MAAKGSLSSRVVDEASLIPALHLALKAATEWSLTAELGSGRSVELSRDDLTGPLVPREIKRAKEIVIWARFRDQGVLSVTCRGGRRLYTVHPGSSRHALAARADLDAILHGRGRRFPPPMRVALTMLGCFLLAVPPLLGAVDNVQFRPKGQWTEQMVSTLRWLVLAIVLSAVGGVVVFVARRMAGALGVWPDSVRRSRNWLAAAVATAIVSAAAALVVAARTGPGG